MAKDKKEFASSSPIASVVEKPKASAPPVEPKIRLKNRTRTVLALNLDTRVDGKRESLHIGALGSGNEHVELTMDQFKSAEVQKLVGHKILVRR